MGLLSLAVLHSNLLQLALLFLWHRPCACLHLGLEGFGGTGRVISVIGHIGSSMDHLKPSLAANVSAAEPFTPNS